jgi:nitroimidazol reductase NimA-like FMN-containing flavoprotein (pyridoxamine 5'-phosphate oxidase superfamily)
MMNAPTNLKALSQPECAAKLAAGCVGRVGMIAGGWPHVLPVNYAADTTCEVLYRTVGESLLATVAGQSVVFEVDGFDEKAKTGWSVCVHGEAREVLAPQGPAALLLTERTVVTWAPGARDRWFAITPTEVTGRQLPMAGVVDHNGWIEGVVS